MQESFIFYRSFCEVLEEVYKQDPKTALELYRAISNYALKDEEPKLTGYAKAIFLSIKPQIDANKKRYEDGRKGGRPKKEKTTGFEKEKPLVSENAKNKKPNVNVNDNVNDNVFINNEEKNKISDPTVNPVTEKFIEEYKKNFNSTPFLNYAQRMKLVEIANDNPNFIENIPLLLEKFSSIEFEFKDGKKKPGLSWLIDKENWSAVLNGDFDKHTEGECQNEYNPCL